MRHALKGINWMIIRGAAVLFGLVLGISAYALWDNSRVYSVAKDVASDLYKYKPVVDEETGKADFTELKEINSDVVAWLTLNGTAVDYPVLQGEDNMSYMNTDVFGEFSLAGSIFIDSRNSCDLSDPYSIIYGHHMEDHLMFGDLDLFKDLDFFTENRTASITTEDGVVEYQVYAIMETIDSTQEIFNPNHWTDDLSDLVSFIEGNSIFVWNDAIGELGENESIKIVALVTCSSGYTGERTILFLVAKTSVTPGPDISDTSTDSDTSDDSSVTPPPQTGDSILYAPVLWAVILGLAILAFVLIHLFEVYSMKQKSKHRSRNRE